MRRSFHSFWQDRELLARATSRKPVSLLGWAQSGKRRMEVRIENELLFVTERIDRQKLGGFISRQISKDQPDRAGRGEGQYD